MAERCAGPEPSNTTAAPALTPGFDVVVAGPVSREERVFAEQTENVAACDIGNRMGPLVSVSRESRGREQIRGDRHTAENRREIVRVLGFSQRVEEKILVGREKTTARNRPERGRRSGGIKGEGAGDWARARRISAGRSASR